MENQNLPGGCLAHRHRLSHHRFLGLLSLVLSLCSETTSSLVSLLRSDSESLSLIIIVHRTRTQSPQTHPRPIALVSSFFLSLFLFLYLSDLWCIHLASRISSHCRLILLCTAYSYTLVLSLSSGTHLSWVSRHKQRPYRALLNVF